MATQAQIEANRRNAQRSTGPKTATGKQRVSRNAVRHGILARVLPEETEGFEELLKGLYTCLKPADEAQRFLVDQIAVTIIRLQRVSDAERRVLEHAPKQKEDEAESKPYQDPLFNSSILPLAIRYEAACNRQIQRNLQMFREMKSEWNWTLARKGECPYLAP